MKAPRDAQTAVRKTAAVLTALLAVVVVSSACTTATAGTAGGVTAAGPVPSPALERFYAQRPSWGSCTSFAQTAEDRKTFSDSKYDCAYFEVPLDYTQPTGKTAQIGVIRRKATDQANRIGSLLTNPGGPGASGMSQLPSITDQIGGGDVGKRFDLIGFDPRGIGASTPAIKCLTPAERDAERLDLDVDTSPAGVAQTEAEWRAYADKCVARTGKDVLANVGTRDVVRDMDVLRSALGDQKLTYLGYSYGTRIGTTYAEAFPANVRAMVLDGAVDPTETALQETVAQLAAFQKAFNAFAADCAHQAGCALGTDPAAATAKFRALVLPLIDKPLPVGNRALSYPDAVLGALTALYSPQLWSALRRGLSDLAAGRGDVMLLLADAYDQRSPDGSYTNIIDSFNAVRCVDDPPNTDRAKALEADHESRAVAPFTDDGHSGAAAPLDLCAFWPVPATLAPHVPKVNGLAPVVVVSTTGDPATPYQAGVDLAKSLGGRLLTVEGTQHTASFQGNSCVDDAATKYLVDLTLPADGIRCPAS